MLTPGAGCATLLPEQQLSTKATVAELNYGLWPVLRNNLGCISLVKNKSSGIKHTGSSFVGRESLVRVLTAFPLLEAGIPARLHLK